jgi:hypothetical protein
VWLVIAIVYVATITALRAPREWRLALALPVWLAAIGFLQARAHT